VEGELFHARKWLKDTSGKDRDEEEFIRFS
jgi:hypothetical protein